MVNDGKNVQPVRRVQALIETSRKGILWDAVQLPRSIISETYERRETSRTYHLNYVFDVSTLLTLIHGRGQITGPLGPLDLDGDGRAKPHQSFARSSEVSTSRSTRSPLTIPATISGTSATVTRP